MTRVNILGKAFSIASLAIGSTTLICAAALGQSEDTPHSLHLEAASSAIELAAKPVRPHIPFQDGSQKHKPETKTDATANNGIIKQTGNSCGAACRGAPRHHRRHG